jgi:predicted alpha/beta superfamily hydrolase
MKNRLLLSFVLSIGLSSIGLSACSEQRPSKSATSQNVPDTLPGITGDVRRFENFSSKFVEARNIDVWLPPDYDKNKSKRYAVIYMHDGQNLFNPKESFMTQLIAEKKIQPAIVIAVWNTPNRRAEYMPQKAFEMLPALTKTALAAQYNGEAFSDRYLKFLVSELKPFIDSTFHTMPQRETTFMMGSSMGGLISLYAICEYPDIFGGAGCISTHFPAGDGIVIDYMKTHLPDASIKNGAMHKIYFDYGTETLDKDYEPYQTNADKEMQARGFTEKNWLTKKFVGDEHSERSWRKRVDVPLTFLLKSDSTR